MQHGIVARDPDADSVLDGVLGVARIVRQILVDSSPNASDLRGRCYVASVLLVNGLSMLFPQTAPAALTGWVLPDGHVKNRGENNHGWVLVHLQDETYFLDVTLTQFASVLDTAVPPIVLMTYSSAKSRYHLVDAEPLRDSQEYSTAFIRAVSDGSLLMAEMWRHISQAEIGFAWDVEQIPPAGQGPWGAKCTTCGKPLPHPRFTIVGGPHCPACIATLPGQQYNIIAMLAFEVKAQSQSAAKRQVEELLATHGLHGIVKELGQPEEPNKKKAGAKR